MSALRSPSGLRALRLRHYDYTTPAAYFVTACTWGRLPLFGTPSGNAVLLNQTGRVVEEEWSRMHSLRRELLADEFVVMPDHIHAIVIVARALDPASKHPGVSPRSGPPSRSLGAIMGGFKAAVSRRVNAERGMVAPPVWQRNHYERVIRDAEELHEVRRYIRRNPVRAAMTANWFRT